jgi:hypothetical protein
MGQFGRVVRCGFCETLNPVGEVRCKVCKEPLGTEGDKLTFKLHEDEFPCPQCKGPIRKGMVHCTNCGMRFCRKCRQRPAENQGYCKECAAEAIATSKKRKRRR